MTELRYRWIELAQPAVTAWPAWNLARDEAREAIRPLFDH
jgi:hypothetical protein